MKTGKRHKVSLALAAFMLSLYFQYPAWSKEYVQVDIKTVISAALEHNLQLKVKRLEPQISEQVRRTQLAAFDPIFSVETTGTAKDGDDDGSFSETNSYEIAAAARKKFTPGTDISLSLDYSKDSVDSINGDGDGSTSQFALVVTQPLLKNRGREINLRDVTLAGNDLEIARLDLKQAVIDTVSQAQELYWQYYYALAYLDVQQKSLDLARESMAEMEEKITLGSAPRLDLLSSQSEVASREENVIVAENNVSNSRDDLLNYIYGTTPLGVEVTCVDRPHLQEISLDEQTLIDYALEHRTDYLSQQIQIKSARTDVTYYDNQRLPQVDLSASLGLNTGDADNKTLQAFQSDKYTDYTYGMVSLSVTLPFGQRRDTANHASALLRKRQAHTEQERIRSKIGLEVRTAVRGLLSARKRYQAALVGSRYAQESLRTEEEKLANGLSTSYQVLLHQRDLADAQATEVEATVQFQTAMIQLHRTIGSTLEEHTILLEGEAL